MNVKSLFYQREAQLCHCAGFSQVWDMQGGPAWVPQLCGHRLEILIPFQARGLIFISHQARHVKSPVWVHLSRGRFARKRRAGRQWAGSAAAPCLLTKHGSPALLTQPLGLSKHRVSCPSRRARRTRMKCVGSCAGAIKCNRWRSCAGVRTLGTRWPSPCRGLSASLMTSAQSCETWRYQSPHPQAAERKCTSEGSQQVASAHH